MPTPKPRKSPVKKKSRISTSQTRARVGSAASSSVVVEEPVIRPRRPTAFVASATRIKLNEKTPTRRTEQWQNDAWQSYEVVGEVQHSIDFLANAISKIRLFPAIVPDDPRLPPRRDEDPTTEAALRSLRSKITGTYSAILREAAINLFVPGECYLIGLGGSEIDASIETWEIYSVDEVELKDGKLKLRAYPGAAWEEQSGENVIIRIHLPHPRFSQLPISPLRGVLASADEIQRIERVIRAAARSRVAGPGLLLIPEEASFGAMDVTSESDSEGGDEDPFNTALMNAMLAPIQDEGSAAAVVPIVLRAPGDVLDKIKKVDLSIAIDTELIKLERAITRLAQGLPLPPEIVTGKAGLSHWSSFSVDEATITAYVEPFTVPIVDALTLEFYRPFLIASGMSQTEAEMRMLWYDVTPLITRPNRSADADYGLDHLALSDSAWRRIKGFAEEDGPTPIEVLRRLVVQRGSFDPTFTDIILRELGIAPKDMDEPKQPVINQPPSTQPESPDGAESPGPPDARRPKSLAPRNARGPGQVASLIVLPSPTPSPDDISLQLATLDRDLLTRLHSSADAALTRALEKANSTVLSKLRKHKRYGPMLQAGAIPKSEAASRVGKAGLAAEGIMVSELLAGSFDSLITRFIDWSTRTYSKVSRLLDITLDPSDLISAAAEDLKAALTSYAAARLMDPAPSLPSYGELDENSISPISLIRQSLRQAGGNGPQLLPSTSSYPTGIATGHLVLSALSEKGWGFDGWEWCYASSVRSRDFDPHLRLDGVRFDSFNDPSLVNPGVWPPVVYLHPGDHDGCCCTLAPLLSPPIAQEATR